MKNKLLVLLLLLGSQLATAQDLLITNAILHTQGKDGVIENTDILIKAGRIARIAPRIPTNKKIPVINAEGHHVTPALFAGLTVSGLSEVEAVRESVDSSYSELYTDLMHPEFDVRIAYNPPFQRHSHHPSGGLRLHPADRHPGRQKFDRPGWAGSF